MSTTARTHALTIAELGALTAQLRARNPRQAAAGEIRVESVPVRTCYETMTRLTGRRDAVLDHAAFLFSEERSGRPQPIPPLTIEEAHLDDSSDVLTLLLSRGSYTAR
ncbi:MAG TPA: hypothetical protein VHB25_07280 [Gemmatimonadaceae bacterium]|nr:hypothetical protein [Gemmatimonadaceae bacterium]